MAHFTNTITVYQKQPDETWKRTVVHGVQWADKMDRYVSGTLLKHQRTTTVTLPDPAYKEVDLSAFGSEDAIVLGDIADIVTDARGGRVSDLVQKYGAKAGIIRSVNDNTNRDHLPNVKVVVY